MKQLFIFLPLLCLISCTKEYNNIETIVQIKEKKVSATLAKQTRQQLIQRLQYLGFKEVEIKQGESPVQFVISTKIETENDERLQQYRNVFRKGELGIWHTYRNTNEKMREIWAQLSGIPGLEFKPQYASPAVFVSCIYPDSLYAIKQKMEKHFSDFENIQFLWSDKPEADAYQLYAIDTRGKSTAPITNKHISDARYDLDYTRNIYMVTIEMYQDGAVTFGKMTRQTLNRELAIVMDDKVISAPTVQGEIKNGRVEITGDFTPEEVVYLSDAFSRYSLPYTLKIIDEKITPLK